MGLLGSHLLSAVLLWTALVGAIHGSDVCAGPNNKDHDLLNSPNWPGKYAAETICSTTLTVSENRVIELYFAEFLMEPDTDCKYDFLKVYDGADTSAKLIGTYCGSQLPPTIISSTNQLHLSFKSDSSNEYDGFRAVFTAVRSLSQRKNSLQKGCSLQSQKVTIPDGSTSVDVHISQGVYVSLPAGLHSFTDSSNCTANITVTPAATAASLCPPSYVFTDRSTGIGVFSYTESGVVYTLPLPAGTYNYSYETNPSKTLCPQRFKVIDFRVQRRLRFEANYNISCDVTSSAYGKTMKTLATIRYAQIDEVCAGKCSSSGMTENDIELSCKDNVTTVVWPTDKVFRGNATDVTTGPLYDHLLPGLQSKSILEMVTFIDSGKGQEIEVVNPNTGVDGTRATPTLKSFCPPKYMYDEGTDMCSLTPTTKPTVLPTTSTSTTVIP